MDSGTLLVPLAPDCEAMRQGLIANPLPPVWELDAATARRLHRDGTLAARVNWQPDLDALPVSSVDTPASDRLPARRTYRPDGADDDTPCLVWLHGGGWVLGDLDTADATARTASAATGWTVVSVDYRCAPVARFPDAVDDAVAAADAALREHRRVVVGGDSAGATLAAVVAQQRGSHPGLVGQVLVYPAADPRLRSASAHQFVDGPLLTRRDMEWFYDQYLADDADRESPLADLVAGLATVTGVLPPAVVLTVGHDPLRDEGIAYARHLADRGGDVRWIHAPELHHGAFSNSGYLPSAAVRVGEVWAAARGIVA